jgi:sugar diacid utilization regulator
MADAVTEAMRKLPVRVLLGITDNLVTIIVSGTQRISGWTAPQSLLADRILPQLRTVGPAALIGVSTDAPSTSHIPTALREAKFALDFASVGNRVVTLARVPFRDMLVRVASEQIQSALPAWVDALLEADKRSRGALLTTLRAYADADMNALKAATTLQRHPNTLYARMQRVADITGLNPLSFNSLSELLLATNCAILDK